MSYLYLAKMEKLTISLKANKSPGKNDRSKYAIVKKGETESTVVPSSSATARVVSQKSVKVKNSNSDLPVVTEVFSIEHPAAVTSPSIVEQKPAKQGKSPRKSKQTVKTELMVDTNDSGQGIKLKLILSPKHDEIKTDAELSEISSQVESSHHKVCMF